MNRNFASTPTRRLIAVIACGAIGLAACGGDDDGDAAPADDTSASSATEAPGGGTSAPATDPTDEPAGSAAPTDTAAGTGAPGGDCRAETLAELVPAAQEESEVTVYSSQGPDELDALAAAFEDTYDGIDVEIVRDVDSTAIARVETEQQTGSVTGDFVVTAAPGWVTGKADEGWFVAPVGPQFVCDSDYDADTYVADGNFFNVSAVVFSYAWNTDLYPEGVDGYEGLLDPALADGNIGVVDPAIAPVLVDYYAWLDETFGDDFTEQLAAQSPRIYPGAGANQEALVSGEIMVSSYVSPVPTLDELIADGAPIDYGVPEQAWGAKFYGTIMKGSEHPNAAQLFADFMVTAQGQELIHSGATVVPDVPRALTTVDQIRDIDLEGQQPEAVAAFLEEWNGMFR